MDYDPMYDAVYAHYGVEAVLTTIKGRAWITGVHQYFVDPSDPWPQGYVVSDTWGTTDTILQGSE